MKLQEVRLLQEPHNSFIVYHEKESFTPWHFHPEFELVYIAKGRGKRMIGDHIDRFTENDLIFLGSYVPHEWCCDQEYYDANKEFYGEGIVVQFQNNFLGEKFMQLSENTKLINFFNKSAQGCKFYGYTKTKIISYLKNILDMNNQERLYALLRIFNIFSNTKEYKLLSSPGITEPFKASTQEPLSKAWQYIITNFQKDIKLSDLLDITCMSNTTFSLSFKKIYRMSFKEYLLNVRIGYACRQIQEDVLNISEIAYNSGFQNISNFNRQFKKIKGITPKDYKLKLVKSNEMVIE